MRYYSAKGIIFIILICCMLIMAVISLFDKAYIITIILFSVSIYLVWMWFDTYYVIEEGNLFYKCGLLKGAISIDTITGIVRNKKQYRYSGIKPALSTKGLIVKYNKWDDIFISPKDVDLFINNLKEINNKIEVIG